MTTAALSTIVAAALAAAPPAPPPRSSPLAPAPAPIGINLYDNFAIPTFQVVAAEGIIIGSFLFFDAYENDATLALALLSPLIAPLATCLIGRSSVRYRGSCWHSYAGTALGLISGVVVLAVLGAAPGLNPFHKGYDDTQEFVNTAAAAAYVLFIGMPIGSVVGWNVGKKRIGADAPPPSTLPPSPRPLSDPHFGFAPPRLMVPLLTLTF